MPYQSWIQSDYSDAFLWRTSWSSLYDKWLKGMNCQTHPAVLNIYIDETAPKEYAHIISCFSGVLSSSESIL